MNKLLYTFFLFGFPFYSISQNESNTSDSTKNVRSENVKVCEIYEKHQDWLPDAFVNNANCACLKIPQEPRADTIRKILAERLAATPDSIKNLARTTKIAFQNKEISKREYKKFIVKYITPSIYQDHIIAYQKAGCNGDPAPFFGWKQITTRKVKSCNMVWFSIRYFGGSCSGKWGKW